MKDRRYWLVKSEPTSYSIEHLKKDKRTSWTGIRNYQARNFMREMKIGDEILFYHSNCAVPGVYGIARVASGIHPDETQFDRKSSYYEPRAAKEKPVWECVDIGYARTFKNPVTLGAMRIDPALSQMHILRAGSRLSVTPVNRGEFERIRELGE